MRFWHNTLNQQKDDKSLSLSQISQTHSDIQLDAFAKSTPTGMEDQNAVETDSYGSAVGTEDSASVGVKEYLQKLKLIKLKYQDICHDLVMEENMNIMNATAEVIGGEDADRCLPSVDPGLKTGDECFPAGGSLADAGPRELVDGAGDPLPPRHPTKSVELPLRIDAASETKVAEVAESTGQQVLGCHRTGRFEVREHAR